MNIQNKNHLSIIFVGHFSVDNIIRFNRKSKATLGGSTSYGSLALRTYTQDVNIKIISHIGKSNFDDSLIKKLKKKKIDLTGVKFSENTNTNFILDYFNHSRILTLKFRSPDLDFNDIPQEYLNLPPDILVLVPLCNEISFDFISKIVEYFPNVYIGIDLQGFIRKIDEDGKVSYIYDEEIFSNITKIITLVGKNLILKGSGIEMKLLARKGDDLNEVMNFFEKFSVDGIYIMTLGEKGSYIVKNGEKILKIPAYKSKKVIDETGAGDIYFSIFLYEFVQSDKSWKSVSKAAHLASAAASFVIEKKSTNGFEPKKKVLKRIEKGEFIK